MKKSPLAVLIAGLFFFSCTKSQEEFYPENRIIDISVRGLIAADSLQFKLGDRIVKPNEEAPGLYFTGNVSADLVSNGATTFAVFNGKNERLLEKKIDGTEMKNFVKFFYDGTAIIDKLPPLPAITPGNVGVLLTFPDRKYSKVAAKDILAEITLTKRGQPTIKKTFPLKEDGTVFIDLNVPAVYSYIGFRLLNAAKPSEGYAGTNISSNFTLNSPKADKGYVMLAREYTDAAGTFYGVEGIELTQYF
ncbi:hypothetical protein [Chitinophaga qingshengii]|uniref:DUF4397 domain-containing protein n=1 Tax=Chitinophaga qingshengii TaxID=1569794 RepID=A0ABR7TIA1_9BACT|nr:hypothetical protein [Chitinophaga qingshengii]MBC9930169.1 hypothetical protein [Chitinophaga qingshengii]